MLVWILGAGAVLCILYFIVIVIYSGITTSFAFIWLLFAAALGLLAYGEHYYRMNPKKVPLWMPVSITTFCLAGVVIFAVVEILVFTGVAASTRGNLDYVIVLGARVKPDGLSNSLKKRLDKAIEYVEQNPDTVLVLSGGKGKDEPASEAEVMYAYLEYNGVNPENMVMETYSESTLENIAYSKVLIDRLQEEKRMEAGRPRPPVDTGAVETAEERPLEIGILTSNFHVFRAVQIAKKWGITHVSGIASGSDPVLFPHLCVRECLAILKDKLVGNM